MFKRRLYYLLLLTVISYLALLYNFVGLRFLLGCVVAVPLGSFLLLIPGAFSCRYLLEDEGWVFCGARTEFTVTLENRGLFPLGRVLLEGKLKMPGEKERKVQRYLLGVGRKDSRPERFAVEPAHCGEVRLKGARVRIYDALGLFALPVRGVGEFSLYVLPRENRGYGQELERVVGSHTDAQEDVYIRGYRQGDSIHRIYWKLSAKEGELQVRDYEPGSAVSLYLDFEQGLREQPDKWDAFLEKAAVVLKYLSGPGQNVTDVVWSRGGSLCRYSVYSGDDAAGCLCAVLGQKSGRVDYWELSVIALEQGYRLDGEGRLYLGGTQFL